MSTQCRYGCCLQLVSVFSNPIVGIEVRKRIIGGDDADNNGNVQDKRGKEILREKCIPQSFIVEGEFLSMFKLAFFMKKAYSGSDDEDA